MCSGGGGEPTGGRRRLRSHRCGDLIRCAVVADRDVGRDLVVGRRRVFKQVCRLRQARRERLRIGHVRGNDRADADITRRLVCRSRKEAHVHDRSRSGQQGLGIGRQCADIKLFVGQVRLFGFDYLQPFLKRNAFRASPRQAGMGMRVCIDETWEQGAPVCIDHFVGVGWLLSGYHRGDQPVPDLHLAKKRLSRIRSRQDQSILESDRAWHHRIAFASCPRVAHRSRRPKTENEITPSTASITIATNSRSVRSSVAEVMMR